MRYGEDEIVPGNVLDKQVLDPLGITPAQTAKTDPYVKAPTVLAAAEHGAGRACLRPPHSSATGAVAPVMAAPQGEGMPARCFLAHQDCGG